MARNFLALLAANDWRAESVLAILSRKDFQDIAFGVHLNYFATARRSTFYKRPTAWQSYELLAEYGHSAANEICDMFSSCALCQQDAVFPVVVLEKESWLGESDSGKLRLGVYGLCEACEAILHVMQAINRKLFDKATTTALVSRSKPGTL